MARALLGRLLAYHPGAGFALLPVGVVAASGEEASFELVPAPEAEGWAERLGAAGPVGEEALRRLAAEGGTAWGIELSEEDFDGTPEGLRALVASSFEALLVERALLAEEVP